MSFFDALKKIFGIGTGAPPPAAGTSSNGAHEPAEGESGAGPSGVRMISCEEALHQIQEYLDGALEGVSAEEVRRHFEICQVCYPHLALEESFRAALSRTIEGQRTPPELRDQLLRALEAESRRDDG